MYSSCFLTINWNYTLPLPQAQAVVVRCVHMRVLYLGLRFYLNNNQCDTVGRYDVLDVYVYKYVHTRHIQPFTRIHTQMTQHQYLNSARRLQEAGIKPSSDFI